MPWDAHKKKIDYFNSIGEIARCKSLWDTLYLYKDLAETYRSSCNAFEDRFEPIHRARIRFTRRITVIQLLNFVESRLCARSKIKYLTILIRLISHCDK